MGGSPRSGDISRHTTGGVSTDHLWGVFFFNFYVSIFQQSWNLQYMFTTIFRFDLNSFGVHGVGGRSSSGTPSRYTKFGPNRLKTEKLFPATLEKALCGEFTPSRVPPAPVSSPLCCLLPPRAPVLTEAEKFYKHGYIGAWNCHNFFTVKAILVKFATHIGNG